MARIDLPDPLLEALRRGQRFLITSHRNPDGDAVGSAVGLSRALASIGKSGVVWLRDPVPSAYAELPGVDRVRHGPEPPSGLPESFDGAIVLECPQLDRSGLEEALSGLEVVNIDHHLGNTRYGKVNWVDTAAPALGEMILHLARKLRATIDGDTAAALYLALVTDTGGFRFANANERAFEAAAELARLDAQPDRVARWLYESRSEGAVRLLGELLRTLELHHAGRAATAVLTREMFARAGAGAADAEGLIDYPRSIGGVEIVAVVRELEDGTSKVSLRSRGPISVEAIARRHGGGGHKNAAGYSAGESVEETRAKVVGQLAEALP